jgi:hypothetical protein
MRCKQCEENFDLAALRKKNRSARGDFCSGECYRLYRKLQSESQTRADYAKFPPQICTKCGGGPKPSSSFYFRDGSHTGLQHYCKECLNKYQGLRWQRVKARAVAHLGGRCSVCGLVDNPVVYDFHHRLDGKTMDWTTLMRCAWGKIVAELSLCELLCANCHRKEHAGQVHVGGRFLGKEETTGSTPVTGSICRSSIKAMSPFCNRV